MKQTPSIGRIVHYILSARESATNAGVARPAIITRVSDGGECGLTVFPDCHHDQASATVYVKSAKFDEGEGNKPGTWRWPPYVAPVGGEPNVRREFDKPTGKTAAENGDSKPSLRSFTESDSELTKMDPGDEPPFSDEDSKR